jgi:hypothetical protein
VAQEGGADIQIGPVQLWQAAVLKPIMLQTGSDLVALHRLLQADSQVIGLARLGSMLG